MKLLNFTVIKLTLFLITGIIIGYCLELDLNIVLYVCVFLVLASGLSILITKSKFGNHYWLSVLLCITTICVGILTSKTHDQKYFKNHYSKHIQNQDSTHFIQFRVSEKLKPTAYHNKYIIDIIKVDSLKITGKCLLNIEKDSLTTPLKIDEVYMVNNHFSEVKPPINPHQFDYNAYLKKKYIYHQLYSNSQSLLKLNSSSNTLSGYADKIRETINKKLEQTNFKHDELAIVNALLLGQRQDISKEIYDSYAQAGAIHILAVSGLHVGIILLILNYILKPLELLRKGKYIKIACIVFLLWCFATIAGLSASVTRAVTMFSVFAVAMNLNRPTNSYNTLAISAFILLLFKPNFLFDVGFQLSYAAVLAIIAIRPLVSKIYRPSNTLLKMFWNIFTVTIAAQIGVLPLSLYYFHQFPGLFFLSNLVIIPFLGMILSVGILIIILALLNALPIFLSRFYENIIATMNSFVDWISNQEAFLFQNIAFGLTDVILSYIIIVLTLYILNQKSFKGIVALLIVIIGIQIHGISKKYTSENQFVIFHKSRHTILGIKHGQQLEVSHNLKSNNLLDEALISNYTIGESIKEIREDSLESVYFINNKILLIIDSLGVYNVNGFKPDLVLLRNSPKVNINRLIDSLKPELIISDGSNYTSFQERWNLSCQAKKIPFYQTSEKGAFILNY